ncbi:hypothetical protein EON66_06650 [archaeon]|nr:MAG: hypothetical protein EON66_06650 [archaeon]
MHIARAVTSRVTHTRPSLPLVVCERVAVPESYQRFIVNALRKEFELYGVPIRMHVRAPENPFKARSRSATPSTTSLTKHFKASDAVKSAEKARARKLAFARMARQSAARRAQEAEAAAGAGEERAKPPPFNPARAPPSALRRASKNLRASGGAIKHINSNRLKRTRGQASARNE